MGNTLAELVLEQAALRPQARALVHKNDEWSYSRLALTLQGFVDHAEAIGLVRGDRIAIYLPKCFENVVAMFGSALGGFVFVPINPVLKAAQVNHILSDCEARLIVTTRHRLDSLNRGDMYAIVIDDPNGEAEHESPWIEPASGIRDPRSAPGDLAALFYTSGSTGRPKGVVLTQNNMVVGAKSVAEYLRNSEHDRILSLLPLSFDAGFSQLSTAFCVGASVVLLDFLLPSDVPKTITAHQITGLTAVPPLWMQLSKVNWRAEEGSSLRYFANTGGKMPKTTLQKLSQIFPRAEPFLMYGLTEAFRSTYLPPSEVDVRPDSIGKAIPNVEIRVVDEHGQECEAGEVGELVHMGPLVAQGYWNDPARTAERFRPGPGDRADEIAVWSGDLVRKDESGFLYFVGRNDDMIKTSGYRVSPTELEEEAFASGYVSEVVAIGLEHSSLGQVIALAVVPKSDHTEDQTVGGILAHMKGSLPTYMCPKHVFVSDALPRNPNGKLDRVRISQQLRDLFQEDLS